MNEDTMVIENPETSQSEQAATCDEGSVIYRQPITHKVGMLAAPCFFGVIYLAVAIFMIVLFYRLVRATEKIASKLEGGISVKKEDSNTI